MHPLLSGHVDNALSPREALEVERHLGGCHACASLLNELYKSVAVTRSAPRALAPEGFMEALALRLEQEEARSRQLSLAGLLVWLSSRRAMVWGAAAAALALVALTLRSAPPPSPGALDAPPPEVASVRLVKEHHVALSIASPLEDLSAANLSAHFHADAQ
ncbi:MAG TPA: zf-HC2 domain-containing protein [Chthonomonadales bacterium]|nr:zf-HC2 domain-containing protein [Chthonomonadales bacterium]